MSDETATIEVTASHMPGSVAEEMVKPTIEVDGEPREGNWGVNTLIVSPGPAYDQCYPKVAGL